MAKKKSKAGAKKKTSGEKKQMIRFWIEGHKVKTNGGIKICEQECKTHLTDRAFDIQREAKDV